MRLTLSARTRFASGDRAYTEEKFRRLERHATVHEVRVTVGDEVKHVPPATAEAMVHVGHTHFIAHADGATIREAVDRLVDKVDRQLLRRKERITDHKGTAATTGE